MYPVTDAFLAALRQPNMQSHVLVRTSAGTVLSVTGGQVEMDSRREITRTCSLELTPTVDLGIDDVYALVMSPSVEVSVFRGLWTGAQVEYVPLGVFSTDTATKPRTHEGTISWAGSDRSKKISRARFTDPYQIADGTTLAAAGAGLLQSRWSACPVDFANVGETLQSGIVFDASADLDPWKEARGLFADYGYELAFDGDGVARANPVPDPATLAADFDFGAADTNLVLGGETRGTFEFTYNGVIVTGEGTDQDPPVRAVAWDTDPTSPTYYLGGYGQVPYFQSSSFLTTTEACAKAAATTLAKVKGRREQFSWPAVVNPALEPLDIVTVTIGGSLSRLVVDKLTVPLRADEPMTASARETSV